MDLPAIFVTAGVLGGSATCFRNYHPAYSGIISDKPDGTAEWSANGWGAFVWQLIRAALLGIAAAACVPVFLNATRSDLVEQALTEKSPRMATDKGEARDQPTSTPTSLSRPAAKFLLFGFCTLAAFASARFLPVMSDQLLNQVANAQQTAESAKKLAIDAANSATSANSAASEANDAANDAAKKADDAVEIAHEVDMELSEPESVATTPAVKMTPSFPTDLSVAERSLLMSFQEGRRTNAWYRRSAAGLSQDTGLPISDVELTLKSLRDKGYVEPRPGRGRAGWRLTAAGVNWRP